MLDKARSVAGKVQRAVRKRINQSLASHEALVGAEYAADMVKSPVKSLTFVVLMKEVSSALVDADETDAVGKVVPGEADVVRICARLAREMYHKSKNRSLPPEAGEVLLYEKRQVPFIVTQTTDKKVYIVIRGTYCFADFITDLNAIPAHVHDGLMHPGVVEASLSVYTVIQDLLARHLADHEIIVTGHSLGGGIAAAVTQLLRLEHPDLNTRAIAFGSISCMSRNLWQDSCKYCTTYVIEGDFVPFLSFHNLVGLSSSCLPRPVSGLVDGLVADSQMVATNMEFKIPEGSPFEAEPPLMEDILSDIDKYETMKTTELFPPGNVYLWKLTGKFFRGVEVRQVRGCEYFGRFVKGLTEDNHSGEMYCECAAKIWDDSVHAVQKLVDP
jgi:hypothetical protein